ncbi:MAG: hypothetical protein ACFNME_07180, partial [Actinomyces dentalis]
MLPAAPRRAIVPGRAARRPGASVTVGVVGADRAVGHRRGRARLRTACHRRVMTQIGSAHPEHWYNLAADFPEPMPPA